MNKDKLGKIVALAKHGIGGEKTAAIRLLQRICKKHNLDYDDVMSSGDEVYEYTVKYNNSQECSVIVHVIFKILNMSDVSFNQYRKIIFYECTQRQNIEVLCAIPVYLRAFRKELKRIREELPLAFILKHQLFDDSPPKKDYYDLTPEQRAKRKRAVAVSETMDDVHLRKQIANRSQIES